MKCVLKEINITSIINCRFIVPGLLAVDVSVRSNHVSVIWYAHMFSNLHHSSSRMFCLHLVHKIVLSV